MKFRLVFEGEIRPRRQANLSDIHNIRRNLHPQLKRLWDHPPFEVLKSKWLRAPDTQKNPQDELYARITEIGGKLYAPIISNHLGAELDIVLLRQQPRGQLIGDGGDIDNRLKTLFDALRLPSKSEVQNLGSLTSSDDEPLHCLLKDDALIQRVNVETDRLLREAKPFELMAIINVTVVVSSVTWDTVSLTGG